MVNLTYERCSRVCSTEEVVRIPQMSERHSHNPRFDFSPFLVCNLERKLVHLEPL